MLQQQGGDPGALQDRGWASFVTSPATELALRERVLALASQLGTPMATQGSVKVNWCAMVWQRLMLGGV